MTLRVEWPWSIHTYIHSQLVECLFVVLIEIGQGEVSWGEVSKSKVGCRRPSWGIPIEQSVYHSPPIATGL